MGGLAVPPPTMAPLRHSPSRPPFVRHRFSSLELRCIARSSARPYCSREASAGWRTLVLCPQRRHSYATSPGSLMLGAIVNISCISPPAFPACGEVNTLALIHVHSPFSGLVVGCPCDTTRCVGSEEHGHLAGSPADGQHDSECGNEDDHVVASPHCPL